MILLQYPSLRAIFKNKIVVIHVCKTKTLDVHLTRKNNDKKLSGAAIHKLTHLKFFINIVFLMFPFIGINSMYI